MNLALLVGSLLAVLALAAAARLLGLGGSGIDDPAAAAEAALPGFVAAETFPSSDAKSAVVIGTGGELALLKAHGVHIAARRLRPPVAISAGPDGVEIDSGERRFGRVRLLLTPEQRDRLLTMV